MENKDGRDYYPEKDDSKKEVTDGKRQVGEGQENSAIEKEDTGTRKNLPEPESSENQWKNQDEFIDTKKPNSSKE